MISAPQQGWSPGQLCLLHPHVPALRTHSPRRVLRLPSADRRRIFRDRTNTTFTISALTSASCGVTEQSCFSCNSHLGCSSSSAVSSSELQSQVHLFRSFQSNYPLLPGKRLKGSGGWWEKEAFLKQNTSLASMHPISLPASLLRSTQTGGGIPNPGRDQPTLPHQRG